MTAAMPAHASAPLEALEQLLKNTSSEAKGARPDGAASRDLAAPSLLSTAEGFELALGGGR